MLRYAHIVVEDFDFSQCLISVKCPSLTATSGLRYNSSSDGVETTASFQCIAGFELVGQTFLTCLRNGSWDAEQPTCCKFGSFHGHIVGQLRCTIN